jgi:hypothetical protein
VHLDAVKPCRDGVARGVNEFLGGGAHLGGAVMARGTGCGCRPSMGNGNGYRV